jgi:2-aminoadipate transaminase
MITSGGIEALELLGKSFLDPGDVVVVEGPTYLGSIQSFRSFEATLVTVSFDADGLDVDELEQQLVGGLRPKLVYTIPDHQNPAGVSLTADRRAALVELARTYGFLVIEDVAYRDLGFEGVEARASLWSLGPDVVVQAGTTSKTLFPGVRLGWAAGPEAVVDRLVAAKQLTDQCAGALGQRLFEESERRGWIDDQLERSRALYARKCERMLAALERSMPEPARWTTPRGGFFSWLTLPGVDAVELAGQAVERGVAAVPGTLFFPDGRGADSLRLSFSLVDEEQIAEGVERLGSLL